ncbi:UDP-phosphate galactose phosphotransferase, partial [Klebsiella michiganensis]
MTLLVRNILVSISLALSDFLSFIFSLYLAMATLSIVMNDYEKIVPANQIEGWILLHWLLAFCCVAWYSMRLRHYFYRKTFWFELKEILRTLVIFAVIEIAVMAFTTWSFSRFLWLLTWFFVLLLVPSLRMLTKRVLDVFGLWRRDTWIIGNGTNA